MRDRADKNVDRDHIAVKKDGTVDESGPFVTINPLNYLNDKLVTSDGRLINDPISSRGPMVIDTNAVGVSTEKGRRTHIVGFQQPGPVVKPNISRGGKTSLLIRFFDAGTKLTKPTSGLRYISLGSSGFYKVPINDGIDILMNTIVGRHLIRIDTGDEISYVNIEEAYNRYIDLTTSRVIPTEMPFSNLGGPLFGDVNLGWNSIFHYVFKMDSSYSGAERLTALRNKYWMLRGLQNIEAKNKKIDVVRDGEIVEENLQYEEATDGYINPDSQLPRQVFEVSWLGDGLPIELDHRENYVTREGEQASNPDYMYKKESGRMPVWKNIDHPQKILDERIELKNTTSENFSENSDAAAANEFWQQKIESAQKSVDEDIEWNNVLDHKTLFFGSDGGNPRAARCAWKELTPGVYTMKVDALKSGYCGFDLTYPKRYKVGKDVDGSFVKPSIDGTNDVANELDMRILQKGGSDSELHIYLRPRILKFTGSTIYLVGYIVMVWPYGIPIFLLTPAWLESGRAKYFTPWTNSGGYSFMVSGSRAADNYVNDQMPIPFSAWLFSASHGGGIPIVVVPLRNIWNIYSTAHYKTVKGGEEGGLPIAEDGVPVAIVRKFDQLGKSQLYCIYYFDDGEENPLNRDELIFTSEV